MLKNFSSVSTKNCDTFEYTQDHHGRLSPASSSTSRGIEQPRKSNQRFCIGERTSRPAFWFSSWCYWWTGLLASRKSSEWWILVEKSSTPADTFHRESVQNHCAMTPILRNFGCFTFHFWHLPAFFSNFPAAGAKVEVEAGKRSVLIGGWSSTNFWRFSLHRGRKSTVRNGNVMLPSVERGTVIATGRQP
jgi:hypothetical protein